MTDLLIDHLKKIAPANVEVKAAPHHGGEPYMTRSTAKHTKQQQQQ
jgi:hypothetical protein